MDVLCHIHQQIHKICRLPTYPLRNYLFWHPHSSRLYTKIVYIKRNLWPTIKLQVGVNLDDFEDKIIAGTKSENQFFSGSSSLFRYTRDLNLTIKVRGKSILNKRFRSQPTMCILCRSIDELYAYNMWLIALFWCNKIMGCLCMAIRSIKRNKGGERLTYDF